MSLALDCSGWFDWFAAVSLQALPLLAAVAAADRLATPRLGPRFAAAAWSLVLLKFVLPPWVASPIRVATLAAFVPGPAERARDFAAPLFAVWLAGVLAFLASDLIRARRALRLTRLGRFGSRHLQARVARAVARAHAAVGGSRPPRAVVCACVDGACVAGLWRPTILVPAELAARGGASLDAVLRHECAHLARRDPLRATGVALLRALWWFHPAVHVGARRLAVLREVACDRRAATADPQGYRRTLLETVRPRVAGPVLRFWAGSGALLTRLRALDALGRPASLAERAGAAALTLALASACLPLARPPLPDPCAAPGCLQLRFAVLAELARAGAP